MIQWKSIGLVRHDSFQLEKFNIVEPDQTSNMQVLGQWEGHASGHRHTDGNKIASSIYAASEVLIPAESDVWDIHKTQHLIQTLLAT